MAQSASRIRPGAVFNAGCMVRIIELDPANLRRGREIVEGSGLGGARNSRFPSASLRAGSRLRKIIRSADNLSALGMTGLLT